MQHLIRSVVYKIVCEKQREWQMHQKKVPLRKGSIFALVALFRLYTLAPSAITGHQTTILSTYRIVFVRVVCAIWRWLLGQLTGWHELNGHYVIRASIVQITVTRNGQNQMLSAAFVHFLYNNMNVSCLGGEKNISFWWMRIVDQHFNCSTKTTIICLCFSSPALSLVFLSF